MALRDRSERIKKIIDDISFVMDDFSPSRFVHYWSVLDKRRQWLLDVSQADIEPHKLAGMIKEKFGMGMYSIISYNELGEIISRRKVIIGEKNLEASDVSFRIAKSLLEKDVYDVYLVVKTIEESGLLEIRGGFVNLQHLSEDLDIDLLRITSIAKKYCDMKKGFLSGKIFFTTINLSSSGNTPIIKRSRWDWLRIK